MTLREAVDHVTPKNVGGQWLKRIEENNDFAPMLDRDFMNMHVKDIVNLRTRINGIGLGLTDRLLNLRFRLEEEKLHVGGDGL